MATSTMQFKIYRYDPDKDNAPYMQDISVEVDFAHRPQVARHPHPAESEGRYPVLSPLVS
jgi:hypothetical protein